MGMPREIIFVRLLKQADTDKDGKISAEEFKAGAEVKFVEIDIDKNDVLTPGDFRKYREAQRQARAAMRNGDKPDATAPQDDQAGMPDGMEDADDMTMDDAGRGDGVAGNGKDQARQQPARDRARWRDHAAMRHGGMMGGMMMMRMADTDENGQISKEEAMAAADVIFKRLDVNADGTITIEDMPDRPFP
ncbi:EF-hand domain-containing protein [Ferirhizobium litorale]